MIYLDFQKKLYSTQGEVLLKVQCSLKMRELITLFGKSGAGKTTILRILAGLTTPDFGIIKVQDSIWFSSKDKINIPPKKRGMGFEFTDNDFFPIRTFEVNFFLAFQKEGKRNTNGHLFRLSNFKTFGKLSQVC